MTRALRLVAVLALAPALLPACGGGGGGDGNAQQNEVLEFTANPGESGSVTENAKLSEFVTTGNTGGVPGFEILAFLFFDLAALPAGANIVSARLVFEEDVAQAGGDVYTELGGLALDSVDMGGSLDNGDFDAAVLSPAFATVTARPAGGQFDLAAGDAVRASLTGGRTFFVARIRPVVPSDGDAGTETSLFAEEADAAIPVDGARLIVEVAP
jgi:hypothetical protein